MGLVDREFLVCFRGDFVDFSFFHPHSISVLKPLVKQFQVEGDFPFKVQVRNMLS